MKAQRTSQTNIVAWLGNLLGYICYILFHMDVILSIIVCVKLGSAGFQGYILFYT
jgi:hypothetical protein